MRFLQHYVAVAAATLCACTGLMPRLGTVEPEDEEPVTEPDAGEEEIYSSEGLTSDLDAEEEIHEDPESLSLLITQLAARGELGYGAAIPPSPPPGEVPSHESPVVEQPPARSAPAPSSGVVVPAAGDNWEQTDAECFASLDAAGVRYHKPDFEAEFVKAPILLDGPVEGVSIRPRWSRPNPENAVMDCRLAMALINVAREAKRGGVAEILFYSTYRPVKKPKTPCDNGKKGKKCRAALGAYEKARKGNMSQHRKALAIDIRWFVTDSGETWDVLEDYERNEGEPPCDDEPTTEAGKFMKNFACALHNSKTFNVILTPNANKDHHNHFHMDITPDATWYIIR